MANDKDFILKNAIEVGADTKVTLGTITSGTVDLSTGNYFAETLSDYTTYTFSNPSDVQSFQIEITGGNALYKLDLTTYDAKSHDFSVHAETAADFCFDNTGTILFILFFNQTANTSAVYRYALSTPYDISTVSAGSSSLDVSSRDQVAVSIGFNSDGTKLYVGGYNSDTIYQYSLPTAYSLSGASYDSVSYNTNSRDSLFRDHAFNNNGTKLFTIGTSTDSIYQHSLSTAYDLSSASYDSVSFSVATEVANPFSLTFNSDGTKLFVSGSSVIQEYTLSTAFDLSTISATAVSYTDANIGSTARGLVFSSDGTKMYVIGIPDTVYQYSVGGTATITWPASVEWNSGTAPDAPAAGETDVYTFVTDDSGTSYIGLQTADNLS